MAQRNMLNTSPMIDINMDQQRQRYLYPDHCVFLGGVTNFPPPDIQMAVTSSGNTTSLDTLPLPGQHYDSAMLYGIAQYPGGQHPHHAPNLDLGVGTASSFYIPYIRTPSSGIPVNQGSADQMPSSRNYGPIAVSADEYGRNCYFLDNSRGSYKRKNSDGIPGNVQCFNASSSSSSSVTPLNTRHPDGAAIIDSVSFNFPQYRANSAPSVREVGSQRSVRNRSGAAAAMDPLLMHNNSNFFQGNYMGQSFQPALMDGGASGWTQACALPYMHGNSVGGHLETGHRSSTIFLHSSPLNLRHHNYHLPPPPNQVVRGHNINVHPQVAAVQYRHPANYAPQNTMNPPQDISEMGPRHPGAIQPTGLRIYRSQREGLVPDTTSRHQSFPHLRVLPPDGVAVLDLPELYEVDNFIDHHRDMRLDIEDMSYEELLALGEQIGSVNTGLSEQTILCRLKTKSYSTSAMNINLEEAAPVDEEPDSCIICQEEYKIQEKVGTLDCGHEYHADCLKKWLVVKNVCPICKSEAL